MTAPVVLDEATRAELLPSCEHEERTCTAAAAWVATFTFSGVLAGVPPLHRLLCDVHKSEQAAHHAVCDECPLWIALDVEPIDRRGAR